MQLLGDRRVVGLDIGQAAVKAVAVTVHPRHGVTLLGHQVLDRRSEGILNEEELNEHLGAWMDGVGWRAYETTVGIPQYLATTQVSDFPENAGDNLEGMVAFETQQLSGLSEDAFFHDYHPMEPRYGRKNPVLIGICRESVVNERAKAMGGAGVNLADISMGGIALANAVLDLYPRLRRVEDPQLLLDIGAEATTLVVVAGGQVLFVSSLGFGGQQYNQALSKQLRVSDEEAEKLKLASRLNPGEANSPLTQASRTLDAELRTAVEHWRSQERAEIGHRPFVSFFLTGGCARMAGLTEHVAHALGCPGEVLGVPMESKGQVVRDPAYMIAYGLALQGLDHAPLSISLAPAVTRWVIQRRRAFPYLVGAAVLALILACGTLARSYMRLTEEKKRLDAEYGRLDKCEQVVPQLEDVTSNLRHREKMLLPFVAKGNRARHYLDALHALAEARSDPGWFVYVADVESYEAGRAKEEGGRPPPPAPGRAGAAAAAPSAMMLMGGPATSSGVPKMTSTDPDLPDPFPERMRVEQLTPLVGLVAAGYTKWVQDEPYKVVKEVVQKLKDDSHARLFRDVDILPESERAGREDIFKPWQQLFTTLSPDTRYKAFVLRLPFAEPDINTQSLRAALGATTAGRTP